MDPKVAWNRLAESWTSHDWDAVLELCEALTWWLDRHGCPPETVSDWRVGADWNTVVVRAVCEFAGRVANEVIADPNGIPSSVAFSLSCRQCDCDSPPSFEAAIEAGWTAIRFSPEAVAENFFGNCSEHA